MSNTAISPKVMQGVLMQLPRMSDQIVDDTRHEKVLSYMRLFLEAPDALVYLAEWDIYSTIGKCLTPDSDYRVSSVAIRFLGDIIRVPNSSAIDMWNMLNSEHAEIIQWVTENADSQHALVRFACLYFVRRGAEIHDGHSESLLIALGYQGYVLRRLLDPSHFIVTEACRLLSTLVSVSSSIDERLTAMVSGMASRAFDRQSSAQKKALLSVVATLLGLDTATREYVGSAISLISLRPYLLDEDRLVRDQALDVFEIMIRTDSGCRYDEMFATVLPGGSTQVMTKVDVLVALRGLAAMVKGLNANGTPGHDTANVVKAISYSAVSILADLQNVSFATRAGENDPSYLELQQIESRIREFVETDNHRAVLNQVATESARIVRDFSRVHFNQSIFEVLESLVEAERVQKSPQLLSAVLDAIVKSLKLAKHVGFVHLLKLPELVANFAIGSSGVKALLVVALEIISEQGEFEVELYEKFAQALVSAMRSRLADVEWEARDTVLEIVHMAADTIEWIKVASVLGNAGLLQDVVSALGDPEEYIRASSAQALVSIVEAAGMDTVRVVVDRSELDAAHLRGLIGDSEAIVKRAALELVLAMSSRNANQAWLHALVYEDLYQLADSPDFEVRVRLARVLAMLANALFLETNDSVDSKYVEELQPGTLLIDMCQDSSRYVRRVCLDSLSGLKRSLEAAGVVAADQERTKRRAVVSSQVSFYSKLCEIDFARLEAGLTTEHLYQEALDTQVEDELMQESSERNLGNNILECY